MCITMQRMSITMLVKWVHNNAIGTCITMQAWEVHNNAGGRMHNNASGVCVTTHIWNKMPNKGIQALSRPISKRNLRFTSRRGHDTFQKDTPRACRLTMSYTSKIWAENSAETFWAEKSGFSLHFLDCTPKPPLLPFLPGYWINLVCHPVGE